MANMVKHIIVTDKKLDFLPPDLDVVVMNATDFVANHGEIDLRKSPNIKIINLCSSFDYLSLSYYCSLLAEARGMRCMPSVANILTLNWKRHYHAHLPELNALLEKNYKHPPDEPIVRSYTICFGRSSEEMLEDVGRRAFDLFRFPLMTVEIRLDPKGKWFVSSVEPLSITDLPQQMHSFFLSSLKKFTGTAWRNKEGKKEKYWIAVLYDPKEKDPPSNKAALQKFIKAGKDNNVAVELITKNDFASVLEYDALFIRETTAIDNHTYRFVRKAESEDLPCIDDSQSIIRCCNKVFQYEMLESRKVPLPKTLIIDRRNLKDIESKMFYPAVVKIPDGAFSRGVVKVANSQEFHATAAELLKKSEIILAQEFVESEFDWRIGVLDNEPLFACKYYMAEGHWQIYNHKAKTLKKQSGEHETVPVGKVPKAVLDIALKAARYIGDGLYGVDLKQSGDKIVVMEVNDNPNVDVGVEDQILGDEIYRRIIKSLIRRIEE